MALGFDELKKIGKTFYDAGKLKEYQAILEAQQRIFDLQEENANLKEINKKFGSLDKFEKSLVFEKNAYYSVRKDGSKEGPYCPTCWGGDSKKIRMSSFIDSYYCNRCKTYADK